MKNYCMGVGEGLGGRKSSGQSRTGHAGAQGRGLLLETV